MGTLEFLAKNSGYVITIITFLTFLIKPIRQSVFRMIDKIKKEDNEEKQFDALLGAVQDIQKQLTEQRVEVDGQREVLKCLLRNTITHIYYKYEPRKEIPKLEKENFAMLCEAYFKILNGNTYVEGCYDIIMRLPVV